MSDSDSNNHLKSALGCTSASKAFFGCLALLLVAAGLLTESARAHTVAEPAAHSHSASHRHPYGHQHILPEHQLHQSDFDGAPDDLVLWGELAKAGITRKAGRYNVTFLPSVLALEGKTVTLLGFMAPVHPGELEKQFLLSDTRFLCDTCQTAPAPQSIVEVNAEEGQPVRERPIMVRGKLELVRDSRHGLIYRLHNAKVIQR